MDEIQQLEQAIGVLEAQRGVLGDAVVEAALAPMREKLESLRRKPGFEERRLVTALFADLVGFTAMSERMDPEDVREVLNRYLTLWQTSIEKHGGAVEKFIGDAVMAVFGLSAAHEDDPQRAVGCALVMLDALERLNGELQHGYGLLLAMRVGIHTGPAVVSTLGERKGHDFVAVGDTINLASRLQSAAPENGILISHDTYRHIQGVYDCEALEPIMVKGKEQPVRVYVVCGRGAEGSGAPHRGVEGIRARFVGRQVELELLKQNYLKVRSDLEACVVTISGDPGVGKTRLLGEFTAWHETQMDDGSTVLRAAAYPHMVDMPYSLLRSVFSQQFGILESDTLETAHVKLETGLHADFTTDGQMKTHFIGALLGFDYSHSPHLHGVLKDAKQLRERALFYLGQWLSARARQGPVMLKLDDIQWGDGASLEAVHMLAESCAKLPVFIVCAARQRVHEVHPEWERRQKDAVYHSSWMVLKPLSEADTSQLLKEILVETKASQGLNSLVVEAAAGNPYFLEEMLKMMIEEGVLTKEGEAWRADETRLQALRTPPTLTALLQARIDSLPECERETLQQAAVIGRVFWDEPLALLHTNREDLADCLSTLRQREMVFPHEPSMFEDSREYIFQHGLLWDVTYDTVLRKHRQVIHGRVAAWLIRNAEKKGRSAEFAPLVAQHFDKAGDLLEAARWWLVAGRHAGQRGALLEARRSLDRALMLLKDTNTEERWEVLLERNGLLADIGDLQNRQVDDAAILCMAQEAGDERKLALAYQRMATTYGYQGEDRQALQALESARRYAELCGDLSIQSGIASFQVATLTRLGQYQQAGGAAERSLALARRLGDDVGLVHALVNASMYQSTVGDHAESARLVTEAVELSRKTGNLMGEVTGRVNLGYSYVIMGSYTMGVEELRKSAQTAEMIGARRLAAYSRLNLGLAYTRLAHLRLAGEELEAGIHTLKELGDAYGQAAGLLYLGFVKEAGGNCEGAADTFSAAVKQFDALHVVGPAMDGRSGLARCLLAQGDLAGARCLADLVWEQLSKQEALEFRFDAFLTCADIFDACGDQALKQQVLETGAADLLGYAGRIGDPDWRQSFLEQVPAHRRLLETSRFPGGDRVESN